ncbi:MAG: tautomerase family protein [Rhizobiales bacterium]|nr:tautomerase family protein [Hyphomicrobiales bacterium]
MAQVKIYGERAHLSSRRAHLSEAIHAAAREVLGLPEDKRFHRFIGLERDDFIHPPDRSSAYTIIEISLFEGRGEDTKRALLRSLMARIQDQVGIAPDDLEITLFETPRRHWGIRGKVGDELVLTYRIER